jgi:AraC family transcriptional regulator
MTITFDFRILFDGDLLQIVDIQWNALDRHLTREFEAPLAEITFMRRGVFAHHRGRRRAICDANTLAFFNRGAQYRMSHPVQTKCACTSLFLRRPVLLELLENMGPDGPLGKHVESFTVTEGPCNPSWGVEQRNLLALARADGAVEPLSVEEAAIGLAGRAIEASFRFSKRPTRGRRADTRRAHADITEATKTILADRLTQRLTLGEIASAVHCAPTHLCHVFKNQTGLSIHRYLTRLRLAAALDHLGEGLTLADLAVEMGFTHHSHFTAAFRREFGRPPSVFRPTPDQLPTGNRTRS